MPTSKVEVNTPINQITVQLFCDSILMKNCFFNRVVPIWNNLLQEIPQGKFSYKTAKTKIKEHFFASFRKTAKPVYSQKMWLDYKFVCYSVYACLRLYLSFEKSLNMRFN